MRSLFAPWPLSGPSGWLALVRIWVGVIWAWQGLEMFRSGDFRDLTPKLSRMASTNPFPRYGAFLSRVVLPRARWISPAIVCSEVAIGLGLITGILTDVAAAAGIVMNINFYLAASQNFPCNRPLNMLFIGVQAILIAGGAGDSLSLAAFLR